MEIFNIMEGLRKIGYHIGRFEEIFSESEIEFLKTATNEIIEKFNDVENIDCKTQHTGNHRYPFYNFEEVYTHPYTDLNLVDGYMKDNGYTLFQRWKQLRGNVGLNSDNELSKLMETIKFNIVEKYYGEFGLNKMDVDLGRMGTIGMYEIGDKQPPHFDAGSKRTIFGLIIYLTPSENWKDGMGGELLINESGVKLEPTFGNYIILDFVDNLIEHQVLELLKNYKRYTIISFPSIIENGSVGSNNFLEYKKSKDTYIV